MDAVPSRAADESSSEYVLPATGDENSDATNIASRGIFDVLRDFADVFPDIAVGVQTVMPADVDRDDWADLFQDVVLKAIETQERNPECFRTGSAKRWARKVAKNQRRDQKRSQRKRVIRDEAYLRSISAGNFHAKPPDEEYEDRETTREILRALRVLEPKKRRAVVAHLAEGLTRAEAAAENGISERVLKRALESFRRYMRIVLPDLHPRNSSTRGSGPAVAKPSIVRGTDHDQRS